MLTTNCNFLSMSQNATKLYIIQTITVSKMTDIALPDLRLQSS